ncbi:murein biosynthesis integral membrane protein MurJ [cyanobacterium TDX16]|nr:murein biosynthesis integral membrane protein MurJ [cyanobacterium TDX16]
MTNQQKSRTLAGIAGIVAIATLLSKLVALFRQQAIAAAFGTGIAANAYNYAYIIPSFFLILLGGVNGPIHTTIVSILEKRSKQEAAPLVESITTLVSGVLLLVSIALFLSADGLIYLVGPQLSQTAHAIAAEQLRIMSPMILLSGLIGIGFGTLNTANQYWLLSLSPVLSSITIILGLGILYLSLGSQIISPAYVAIGGQVLAWGTLAGALLQWIVQLIVQWRLRLGTLRLRFDFRSPGVQQAVKLMAPAVFASGMLQINLFTDYFFASGIPGAAAAFNYANLIVQTPLGIISNVILLPLFTILSRLADPLEWHNLKSRLRQGLILTALTMLPLGALFAALAMPIVRIVYERGAFQQDDSQLVASILVAYGIGMFVYLGRDVLVRVFYALGDGETPFRVGLLNIFLNAMLDFILIKPFGAPGITLATVGVNTISTLLFLGVLHRKLHGLPLRQWSLPILGLIVSGFIAGVASWGTLWSLQHFFGSQGLVLLLLQTIASGLVGIGIFALIATRMKLPEIDFLLARLTKRGVGSRE